MNRDVQHKGIEAISDELVKSNKYLPLARFSFLSFVYIEKFHLHIVANNET